MSDVARIAEWVADWRADSGHLLLLTDYDGTLAPIGPDPAAARLPEAVQETLRSITRLTRTRLGFVSGRDLSDLRAHVGVSEAIYAGCYGLEVEGPGLRFRHPEAEQQERTLAEIGRLLSENAASVPGMQVEQKRFGIAVHYRHVALDDVRRVEMEVARAIHGEGSRLKIFHGAKVIEIQPQAAWTKGDCVLWIRDAVRREAGDRVMLLYMGDDWTDEYVFEALVGQGITIRIGDSVPASRAAYRFADVAGARELLAALASAAGQGRA
jgi:trehalose-phosphatase